MTNLLASVIALTTIGAIPMADAPAYHEYAMRAALTNAQSLGQRWGLDTNLIVQSKVTGFVAEPFPDGSSDISIVFGDRYHFKTSREGGVLFVNTAFDLEWALHFLSVREHGAAVEQARHGTSLLTLEAAQRIAVRTRRSSGIAERGEDSERPTRAEQVRWKDGTTNYAVPCYEFVWGTDLSSACTVEVSGMMFRFTIFWDRIIMIKWKGSAGSVIFPTFR
jgi:hypothetical protein